MRLVAFNYDSTAKGIFNAKAQSRQDFCIFLAFLEMFRRQICFFVINLDFLCALAASR